MEDDIYNPILTIPDYRCTLIYIRRMWRWVEKGPVVMAVKTQV